MPTTEISGTTRINPSSWNLTLGFDQAQLRPAPTRLLTCAGQGSVDRDGRLVHEGDVTAQIALAVENVEDLLHRAGMDVGDVLQLTVHATDVDAVLAGYGLIAERFAPATPPATLVGVQRLAVPGMLVEITATAGR